MRRSAGGGGADFALSKPLEETGGGKIGLNDAIPPDRAWTAGHPMAGGRVLAPGADGHHAAVQPATGNQQHPGYEPGAHGGVLRSAFPGAEEDRVFRRDTRRPARSEEHTSELQSRQYL